MSDNRFISSTMYINDPLDCRRLTLSMSFYQLDQERIMALSSQLIHWLYGITGTDFVYDCFYGGKHSNIKKLFGQFAEKFDPANGLSAGFDAYVVSPVVHNLSTFRKFQRYAFYENPVFLLDWAKKPDISIDYPAFFKQIFHAGKPDSAEIPGLVHKIFCEPDRMMIGYHNGSDLSFSINADCYHKNFEQYYGHAEISFSAFCLGNGVNHMAEDLAQFAMQVAEVFTNLCAHVSLQPRGEFDTQYMRYFGRHILHDGSHEEAGCSIKEWYPTYYLRDVAWMNILSPLAKQHIMPIVCVADGIDIQELSGGGTAVRSQKPILQYDVSVAHALKRILLPALYPGWSAVPLRPLFPGENMPRFYEFCPRHDWAIVPIDAEEIEIVGTDLVYTSRNARE